MASLHRMIISNMVTRGHKPKRVKKPAKWTPKRSNKPRSAAQQAQMNASRGGLFKRVKDFMGRKGGAR